MIKKETIEPFDAPLFCSDVATGTTLHEHKGKGIPNNVAFTTEPNELLPRCLRIMDSGKKMCRIPAIKNPNIR